MNDISGQRLPGVSKWSLSFGAEGNVPVALFGIEGHANLDHEGSHRSRFSSNPTPSAYTWVDGYWLHNFRVGFLGRGGAANYPCSLAAVSATLRPR